MKQLLFIPLCFIIAFTVSAQTTNEIVPLHVNSIGELKKTAEDQVG